MSMSLLIVGDQESMQSMPFRVSRCAILEDELRQKSEAD